MEETNEELNGNIPIIDENPFKKGCNASYSTARSKLQKRRRHINDDIIKELLLRRGAKNLLKVATNKEVREKVLIELEFVNSKLELLKSDLSHLNSSVKAYQNENSADAMPMISLGLKETADANFGTVFSNFIEEHYSESSSQYKDSLNKLHALRKAVKTPDRSEAGIELLNSYICQLSHVEKRFYQNGRSVPVYFTWYDSLTGRLTTQKTIGYEKGCVLFNIGALYSQIGTAQDRRTVSGLSKTIDNYQKAAGVFKYLRDRFTNAPSLDMNAETLTLLMQLMLSQGQECLFEKQVLDVGEPLKFTNYIKLSQEAAQVAQMYEETHNAVASKDIRKYVPSSWITMTIIKCNHYRAMAHLYLASALLMNQEHLPNIQEIQSTLSKITKCDTNSAKSYDYGETKQSQKQYCRAHVTEALSLNETARKDYNFCRTLKTHDDVFLHVLEDYNEKMSALHVDLKDDLDFEDIFFKVKDIVPAASVLIELTLPDYSLADKTDDFFRQLGPLSVFCANNELTSPRLVELARDSESGYGFTIKGELPSSIVEIDAHSPAEKAGLKVGDILIKVNDQDVKWSPQREIKALITSQSETVKLTVVSVIPHQKSISSDQLKSINDTVRSSASSTGSSDMKQTDTPSGTMKKKLNQLTFLNRKKMGGDASSLRLK